MMECIIGFDVRKVGGRRERWMDCIHIIKTRKER
jgi:hypothetical protein